MKYDNFSIQYIEECEFDNHTAFKMRHKIYCEQYGFLPIAKNGMEIDEYDTEEGPALTAVIRSQGTGASVAVVRIIPAKVSRRLPFDTFEPGIATARHWGEVSRIGIDRGFKGTSESRKELLVYLFKAVYQVSLDLGVSHWVCMMPTALQLRMAMLGVTFEAVGEPVDYHGLRQPCVGVAHRILSSLEVDNPEMYKFIINR